MCHLKLKKKLITSYHHKRLELYSDILQKNLEDFSGDASQIETSQKKLIIFLINAYIFFHKKKKLMLNETMILLNCMLIYVIA